MKTYLVGGAVRDALLGLHGSDRDWVVVGATVDDMQAAGYTPVGRDFPVFLHPETHEEYALARTERKSGRGYTGFVVHAAPDVTLEQDLQRRDLTINAIAQDREGHIIDPWGGQQDLQKRVLRHVSPAFVEDPLRVLRTARFAARFAPQGFSVAPETLALMQRIADSGELQALTAERVWQEIQTALQLPCARVFFEVLRDCRALTHILPEIDALFGIPQPPKWHPEIDTGLHTLMCLDQACTLSNDPVIRFAVLMHDAGKGTTPPDQWPSHKGHEVRGADSILRACQRLRVPREFTELARLTSLYHTQCHQAFELRPITLLRLLENMDAFRRPQRLQNFLLACEADARGRTGFEKAPYPQAELIRAAWQQASAVDIPALLASRSKTRHSGQEDNPGELIRQWVHDARLQAVKAATHQAKQPTGTKQ